MKILYSEDSEALALLSRAADGCPISGSDKDIGGPWAAQSGGSQPVAGVEMDGLEGPFQPNLFYGSVLHMKSLWLPIWWRFLADCVCGPADLIVS